MAAHAAEQPKLASGALGLGAQLFQSITHMAPAAGVIFIGQYMSTKGGGAHALAWLLATVLCLLTAFCLREVVRKVRSAGGYFVIHSVALGHFVGFTTSWLWFLFETLVPPSLGIIFGFLLSDFLNTELGVFIPWWILGLALIAVVTYISYAGIRQSAITVMVLGSLEIGIMALMAVILIVKAGSNQPLVAFTPSASPEGWGGVFFATVFGILSFLGFESGVPLSEESDNPKRSLTIAIMASVLGVGLYYVLIGYGTVAGWGFTGAQAFADDFSKANNAYFQLGSRAFGVLGPWLVLFALCNSSLACALAGQNAATRVYYSLGRAGVFPRWLNQIDRRTQTPTNAIYFQTVLSVFFMFAFALYFGPFEAWGLLGLLFTLALMIIYTVTNVSAFAIYWFKFHDEFSVFKHLVIPVVATLAMIPPLIAGLAPQLLFGFYNEYPLSLGLPITVGWFLIGLVVYLYLKLTRPANLDIMANEMAHVELAGEEDDPRSRAVLKPA